MPALMILRATLRRTGSSLLGHEHPAKAAFADLLQQLVAANDRASAFTDWLVLRDNDGLLEEAAGLFMRLHQSIHQLAQLRVGAAGLLNECDPFAWIRLLDGVGHDFPGQPFLVGVHSIQSYVFPGRLAPDNRAAC